MHVKKVPSYGALGGRLLVFKLVFGLN